MRAVLNAKVVRVPAVDDFVETDIRPGDVVADRHGGRELIVLVADGDRVIAGVDNGTSFGSFAAYSRRRLILLEAA